MTKIIQRHDTAANWTSVNPVLATGEMGVEIDTNKFKFGDGTTAWANLAYAISGSSGGGGTQLTSSDGTTNYTSLTLGDNLSVSPAETAWSNPRMTSNSQNGYVASASLTSAGTEPYYAFDGDTTTNDNAWYANIITEPQWIMLECPEPVRLTSCMIMNEVYTPENIKNAEIQGSNDGSTFDTLYIITNRPNTTGLKVTYPIETTNYYKYLRIYITASYTNGVSIQEIEFKGFVKDTSATPILNVNLDDVNTEINTLADTKQEKLTAVSPIRIYEYTPDYTYTGYSLDSDNNLIYNEGKDNYVLFPYNKNNLYIGYFPNGDSSSDSSVRRYYGKFLEDGSWQNICFFNVWGFNITLTDGGEQITVSNKDYNSTISCNKNISHSQLWFDTVSGNIKYATSEEYASEVHAASITIDNIDYAKRLSEITHVKYVGNKTNNKNIPYKANNIKTIRYYNLGGYLFDKVTNSTDRSNLFLDQSTYPNLFTYVEKGNIEHKIEANPATSSSLGVVQPDGTSITVNEAGIISGQDVKTFTGYSDTGTLVLKSINGVLQWVAE